MLEIAKINAASLNTLHKIIFKGLRLKLLRYYGNRRQEAKCTHCNGKCILVKEKDNRYGRQQGETPE